MQWIPNSWCLVKGNDESIVLHVLDVDGTPLNISGATSVSLKVPMADGTVVKRAAAAGFSFGYLRPIFVYGFSFTAAETVLMAVKPGQTVEVEVDFGNLIKTIPIAKALTVVAGVY